MPLAPGEETSAEYAIFFPRQLPPREFVLKINLIYSIGGQYQQKLFFNETINVIEEPTLFDTQLIGLYLIGLLALAGIGELLCEQRPSRVWLAFAAAGLPPWSLWHALAVQGFWCTFLAGYFGVEFAKSKGWIKKSKPVVRPGAAAPALQPPRLNGMPPRAFRWSSLSCTLTPAPNLARPHMNRAASLVSCSRRLVQQRRVATRHGGGPQAAQEADVRRRPPVAVAPMRSGAAPPPCGRWFFLQLAAADVTPWWRAWYSPVLRARHVCSASKHHPKQGPVSACLAFCVGGQAPPTEAATVTGACHGPTCVEL